MTTLYVRCPLCRGKGWAPWAHVLNESGWHKVTGPAKVVTSECSCGGDGFVPANEAQIAEALKGLDGLVNNLLRESYAAGRRDALASRAAIPES